jgi:hypothetical protein
MNSGTAPIAPTVDACSEADLCALAEGDGTEDVRWPVLELVSEEVVPFRRMAFR